MKLVFQIMLQLNSTKEPNLATQKKNYLFQRQKVTVAHCNIGTEEDPDRDILCHHDENSQASGGSLSKFRF